MMFYYACSEKYVQRCVIVKHECFRKQYLEECNTCVTCCYSQKELVLELRLGYNSHAEAQRTRILAPSQLKV